jgi:two-component system, NarL family, response regulator NreC
MSVRILLVDDHSIVRDGLRAVLTSEANFRVIGETGDGLQVLSLLDELQPDVLVLDLMLPGLGGLAIARQARAKYSHIRIVILSMHDNVAYVAEAMEIGVLAYVLKQSASTELVQAIQAVLAGQHYLSPLISLQAVEDFQRMKRDQAPSRYEFLSTRERQILHLVTEGLNNQEISQRLGISPRTVESHRANLMSKLNVGNTAELVRYALESGNKPL